MRWGIFALAFVVLSACAETVYLRHPEMGKIVKCGPYRTTGIAAEAAAVREIQCIVDYKEQGYIRIPKP
jgi:hypothetical protein